MGFRVPMLVLSPFSRGGYVGVGGLRPHLTTPLLGGAIRGAGPEPLGVATGTRR